MLPFLFMWWLAIFSPQGQVIYLEYHSQAGCKIIQSAYQRSGITVTVCQYKQPLWK